ncbi:MauE/DoxX family redox-associated membrane protein [Novosphingobium sp. SG720]|uniref:MauE/DoxX family redox-associated membrane protein n=1 Tax=Novosphingobium sp. SG720 TaxID=2586998 RepID=UPI0014462E9C|nr:MauE/DoxX family redox-associated membrane protein [Novosphingobium sp. SG720]NKJ44109.1 hypothetical protein [Novosphingobium sp. SG720]
MMALNLFCAMLLAGSAVHKALARDRLAPVAARLAGTSAALGPVVLLLAGAGEMAAAVFLVTLPLHAVGALLAATIWASYAIALWRKSGQTLDCGCDLAARAKPVSPAIVARPAALSALALILSTLPAAPLTLDAPFAAAGFLALYLGLSELLATPRPAWRTA